MKSLTVRSFFATVLVLSFAVSSALTAAPPKTIIGSSKAEVDALLNGWASRRSNRATESRPIYYYMKDVEIIVSFSGDKAVGVAVVDRPAGAVVSPISEARYKELVALIGGGEPKAGDIKREGSAVREFSVGDAD